MVMTILVSVMNELKTHATVRLTVMTSTIRTTPTRAHLPKLALKERRGVPTRRGDVAGVTVIVGHVGVQGGLGARKPTRQWPSIRQARVGVNPRGETGRRGGRPEGTSAVVHRYLGGVRMRMWCGGMGARKIATVRAACE